MASCKAKKKKFKTASSAGKVKATMLFMLVDIMAHGIIINFDAYVANLKELLAQLSRVRPHRQKQNVLPLLDNAGHILVTKSPGSSENLDG